MQTLGPEHRGRGLAVAYSGGSLGALVTPLIVTPIFLWWGWRAAFWFTGFVGAAWLVMWAFVSRRKDIAAPALPRAPSKAPRPRLSDRTPVGVHVRVRARRAAAGLRLVQRRPVSGQAAQPLPGSSSERCSGSRRSDGRSAISSGAGSPTAALRRGGPRVAGLGRMMAVCAVLNLAFASIPWMTNVWGVLGAMFLAMFVAAGFVVLSVAYATHVYASEHAGLDRGCRSGIVEPHGRARDAAVRQAFRHPPLQRSFLDRHGDSRRRVRRMAMAQSSGLASGFPLTIRSVKRSEAPSV